MDISKVIAEELSVQEWQVEAVVKLIDDGNTIPFIARYRKEAHGSLNDEQLRMLDERLRYLRSLEERKETVLKAIEEQGQLTDELRGQIALVRTLVELEDLYRPYKPKRRTRATIAREKGLDGLAQQILAQEMSCRVEEAAAPYIDPEKGVENVQEAVQGASDILAEQISDRADLRAQIREATIREGILKSEVKKDMEDPQSVYAQYFHYEEPVKSAAGHRVLALNRGEAEKVLSVSIEAPEEGCIRILEADVIKDPASDCAPVLRAVCLDAYQRLISPAIEREIRNSLTEKAEDGAIDVFGKNLRQLLMHPPVAGQVVLGWDPAFRTGCKLAVVDDTGKVLDTAVIYPTAPTTPAKIAAAKQTLKKMIEKYGITLISCGNGTASRESEQIIAELISEIPQKVQYVIVNEAGASVYSASKLATEEFPSFDVGQRSAASIARRLQDPLAELVKIDPKSIGVGQYQHDMNQKKLGEKLEGVVESCVNNVGVDLNTASFSLLEYVSGITKKTAKSIVSWRETNGRFSDRRQLLKVSGLGPKAFEQCAGFLRIRDGSNPLDMTGVHPESYEAAGKLLEKLGFSSEDIRKGSISGASALLRDKKKEAVLAKELGIGEATLEDIAKELEKPGRDPRADMPRPILRSDVLDMKDLKPGMILKGTVRNVIDFGAFVDIGVHQDGLVHISQMSDEKFIKHPLDAVSVGDIVDVKVLEVDLARKRISLTMKLGEKAAPAAKESTGDREKKPKDGRGSQTQAGHDRGGRGAGRNGGAQGYENNRRKGTGDAESSFRGGRKNGKPGELDLSRLMNKWH